VEALWWRRKGGIWALLGRFGEEGRCAGNAPFLRMPITLDWLNMIRVSVEVVWVCSVCVYVCVALTFPSSRLVLLRLLSTASPKRVTTPSGI